MNDSAKKIRYGCMGLIALIVIIFVSKCPDDSDTDSQNYQDLVLPAYNEWNCTEYERNNNNLYYILIQGKKPGSFCFIYGNHIDGSYKTVFVDIKDGNKLYNEYGHFVGSLMVKDDNTVTVMYYLPELEGTYTRKKGTPIKVKKE